MGSKEKYFSIQSASHGFDDVGLAAPSGTISAIGPGGGQYAGKLKLTIASTTLLRKGMPINIVALDAGHSGATRILHIYGPTSIVVDIDYDNTLVDGTGTWNCLGGAGAWDAFMPIGADVPGANLTFTFWRPEDQGSDENAIAYTKDQLYVFPAVIKEIQIATAGNVRLFRAATDRPFGLT